MKLTKPMLRVFSLAVRGSETLPELANGIGKSQNWASEVVSALAEEGYVAKERKGRLHQSRVRVRLSGTPYALKLKELLFQYRTIDFSEILCGIRLDLLAALCLDWKDLALASGQSGVSLAAARQYARQLSDRGVLQRRGRLYRVNQKAWPVLQGFLKELRNYSLLNGALKWKYKDEEIFAIDDEKMKVGVYTGFARFADFGITIGLVGALCYVPGRKLSKEEIFVHSLFEIEDSRTLYLALAFYLKNKLEKRKVGKVAMKYDLYTTFSELAQLLAAREEKLKVGSLPEFELQDFRRVAAMYGVEDV
ncbi:hypothetical protein HYY73_02420 [Candidatus Woesearchaeota archaeon]|nr:hypothetical protein [Candidatus Woesearchaeota archaeon]